MRKEYHPARYGAPLCGALLLAGFGGLPNPQAIAAPPPRLTDPVYADYDSELREVAARADGLKHVDSPALIQKLLDGNIKTYAFLVWHQTTDWNDFRLEFLPAAQAAGLSVWLYLTPPSEGTPAPFGDDFITWASEAGKLATQYPVLTGLAIDDFGAANLSFFTPDYIRQVVEAAHAWNTNVMFLPVVYDASAAPQLPTVLISPAFANAYGPYCGAVIFPYINTTNKDDLTAEAPQIAYNSDVMNGSLAQFVVVFPWNRSSQKGNYAALSQVLTTNSPGFPDAPYSFKFRVYDDYTGATANYHKLQLLVDGSIVWQQDVAGSMGIQDITNNLQTWIRGKTSATLVVRMYDTNAVSNFGVTASWSLPAGNWTRSETGAFIGTSSYYPATPGLNVPLIVMIYDLGYNGWSPTTNYVRQANLIARSAVAAGRASGIIQYCLDKSGTSQQFPIIQQLYGQWAYQPQFLSLQLNGNAVIRGSGGGPSIGYTLKAADDPNVPVSSWTVVVTGAFATNGCFTNTDANASGHGGRFYRTSVP